MSEPMVLILYHAYSDHIILFERHSEEMRKKSYIFRLNLEDYLEVNWTVVGAL